MVLGNESLGLDVVTLPVLVVLVELLSAAGAALTHLLLHALQTLVQLVPLQQTSQLVLGEVSGALRQRKEAVVDEEPKCLHSCEHMGGAEVPLGVCRTTSGVFSKTLSCL